jgi:hypothetical protein
MDVGQDQADLHKGLVLREQSQLDPIGDTRLLKVGEMFGVVDVSLWVQIPVTDFDRMIEAEMSHAVIIPFDKKDLTGMLRENLSGL